MCKNLTRKSKYVLAQLIFREFEGIVMYFLHLDDFFHIYKSDCLHYKCHLVNLTEDVNHSHIQVI